MTPLVSVDRAPDGNQGDPIVQKLAQLIQGVGPDRRLPSEREMSISLGVSRVALRDRLQGFEILGILERRQGSGTFVRQLDSNGLASLPCVHSLGYFSIAHQSFEPHRGKPCLPADTKTAHLPASPL